jgi:hypothetical protein
MPHDPYKSCYGCPKPRPCDRSACDGWQSREAEKEIRYALKERAQAAVPDHAGYKKILRDRQRHNQMKGR